MPKPTLLIHSTFGALLLASSATWATTACDSLIGCERKFCEIQTQINYAEQQQLSRKAAGLRKALSEAKAHCSDAGLRDDLADEIKEAKEDLADYQDDLKEAEAKGNTKKIRKYQEKIEHEQRKLKMLEDERSSLE